jgi:hypothetical protein
MIPKLKEPEWHRLTDCLNRFPIKLTEDQLIQYLLDLKIIKNKYDLQDDIDGSNRKIKTEVFYWSDLDYHVAFLSENCIQMIIKHINKTVIQYSLIDDLEHQKDSKEIEQYLIIEGLEHLLELKELGEATEDEIENYKSKYKLS